MSDTKGLLESFDAMSVIRNFLFLIPVLLLAACATAPTEQQAAVDADIYKQAMEAVKSGYYDDALVQLRDLQKKTGSDKTRAQVDLSIAYTLYKKGAYDEAFETCEQFINQHPGHEGLAYAYYLQGLIRSRQGENHLTRIMEHIEPGKDYPEELREAYVFFSDVVRKFPDSDYSKDAVHQTTRLRLQLAEFELYAARGELIQGDVKEAMRRARYVNEYFKDPGVRKQALEMMARIYKEAGQQDQAVLIERQLQELNASNPMP